MSIVKRVSHCQIGTRIGIYRRVSIDYEYEHEHENTNIVKGERPMTSSLTALPALMMTVSVVSNVLAVHASVPVETIQTVYPVVQHFSAWELFEMIGLGALILAPALAFSAMVLARHYTAGLAQRDREQAAAGECEVTGQ